MNWIINHLWNFISGLFTAAIGYFCPIREIVHIVIFAILLDMITGIAAARKRGEGIKSVRLWSTVYKMFFSVMIISLIYAIDTEMSIVSLHKLTGWLIAGFELWSILENAMQLSDYKIFSAIKRLMSDKIKEITNLNLEDYDNVRSENGGAKDGRK